MEERMKKLETLEKQNEKRREQTSLMAIAKAVVNQKKAGIKPVLQFITTGPVGEYLLGAFILYADNPFNENDPYMVTPNGFRSIVRRSTNGFDAKYITPEEWLQTVDKAIGKSVRS